MTHCRRCGRLQVLCARVLCKACLRRKKRKPTDLSPAQIDRIMQAHKQAQRWARRVRVA